GHEGRRIRRDEAPEGMAREDDGLADDVLHEGTDVSGMIGDAISSWAVRRPPVASEVDGEHAEGAGQCLHDWAVAHDGGSAAQSLRETARMQSAESDAETLLDELSAASGSGIEKV